MKGRKHCGHQCANYCLMFQLILTDWWHIWSRQVQCSVIVFTSAVTKDLNSWTEWWRITCLEEEAKSCCKLMLRYFVCMHPINSYTLCLTANFIFVFVLKPKSLSSSLSWQPKSLSLFLSSELKSSSSSLSLIFKSLTPLFYLVPRCPVSSRPPLLMVSRFPVSRCQSPQFWWSRDVRSRVFSCLFGTSNSQYAESVVIITELHRSVARSFEVSSTKHAL